MKCSQSYLVGAFIYASIITGLCHFSGTDHSDDVTPSVTTSASAPVSDHRFFLHEIFTKYGHDGKMTFEGFEHLLESLGLGNIIITDHDVKTHKENDFRNKHGSHDHDKKSDSNHEITSKSVTAAYQQLKKHSHDYLTPDPTASTVRDTTLPMSRHRHHSHENALPTDSSDHDDSSDHFHDHDTETSTINGDDDNHQHPSPMSGDIYHYQLREVKMPEFLVNISTLVDQHQELQRRLPDITIEQCLSPREILDTFGINQTSSLNPVSFLHLCPAIIYELDQGHCMFRERSHEKEKKITSTDQWLYSCIAVVLISLCGLLSVAVIPIMQKWFYHTLLQFLVGLAVGSLSGDGLLHLMPHAMLGGEGAHDHNDSSMSSEDAEKMAVWRGFAALGGIFFFFVAERLLGSYAAYKKQKKLKKLPVVPELSSHDLTRRGSVGEELSQYRKGSFKFETTGKEMYNMLSTDSLSRKGSVDSLPGLEAEYEKRPSFSVKHSGHSVSGIPAAQIAIRLNDHGHGHSHSHEVPESITAVAWMVIMGDGLHNFCDGLAIGAAFASGIEGGISTTVAVFCHELPHELGDFAMLLKTGMKVKQAMLYNGLSSVLCFVGMVIGVYLGNVDSATSWVFAATAGMFLYIALVDMLPELSAAASESSNNKLYLLAVQVLGICCGVTVMLLIANYEQDLQNIIS